MPNEFRGLGRRPLWIITCYRNNGVEVLTIGPEVTPVAPGTIAYVAAGVEHRFSEITENLEVLVFWAPARDHGKPHMQARGSGPYDR